MSHATEAMNRTTKRTTNHPLRREAEGAAPPRLTGRAGAAAQPAPTALEGGFRASMLAQFRLARSRGVPLVGIATPDPGATIESLLKHGGIGEAPALQWDVVRGLRELNAAGATAKAQLIGDAGFDPTIGNCAAVLEKAAALPPDSLLVIHLAHRWLGDPSTVQAAWTLRDLFKINHRTLVLLAPSMKPPIEISGDMLIFDEPLPDARELAHIVAEQLASAELPSPPDDEISRAIEALQGLSSFQAEQVIAMSLTRSGVQHDALWERKCRQIELTPGLSVFRGGETFADIGGCTAIKEFAQRVLDGADRPNAVVFVDEIEKMLAGSGGGGDTSGVSQDQLGQLLTYMQDHNATGMLFVGPPGSAKSMMAKAAGNYAGIPTIRLDLGAAKGSLVGESEQQVRAALKVITSVGGGRSLWIATCNSIADLPPELRRRFTLGTWFFDLPTADERGAIWRLYLGRYGLDRVGAPCVADDGWTGAEIRQCCELAWRLGCSISSASEFVVPVSRSAADQITRLRTGANGRFLSAQRGGVYRHQAECPPAVGSASRRVDLGGGQ